MRTGAIERLRGRLQADGWTLVAGHEADLCVRRNDVTVVIEVNEVASSGWDHLRGGLADAILRSQRAASLRPGANPVAVVAAPRVSNRMIARLSEYRDAHAPDVSWGVVDDDGRIDLHGVLELRVPPTRPARGTEERRVNLWSDLGQWVLKVVVNDTVRISSGVSPRVIGMPGAQFADSIGVSRSFAWQITAQLRRDGFLDDDNRVLRLGDLLQMWRHRQERPRLHAMSWLIPGGAPRLRLLPMLAASGSQCLAGYTACREHGIAIVPEGVFEIQARSLRDLEMRTRLVPSAPGERVDVLVRVPATPEAVFRAVTVPADDGATAADLLQCWLDLVDEPGRGGEQADVIWRERFHLP